MIKRADGRYQEQITINGKRKYFYGKTQNEVKRKIAAYSVAEEKGKQFAIVADEWDGKHRERVTYNAWAVYAAPLRRVKEHFQCSVKDIRPGQIQSLISELAKQSFARRTVQLYLDMLRMIFDYAVVSGYVSVNPCTSVHLPAGLETGKREIPTDDEIKIVKESVDISFGLFAYFALYSGLRRGEMLALKYDDIDFENKIISVSKSVYYEVNQPRIKLPKTRSGIRKVILLDVLSDKLDKKGKGYIFGGNSPITKSSFRKRWARYQKETGLGITPHQLRHAFATICYEAEIDEKAAQDLLGHASIKVTRDIYTHIRNSRRNDTATRLNDFVNSII